MFHIHCITVTVLICRWWSIEHFYPCKLSVMTNWIPLKDQTLILFLQAGVSHYLRQGMSTMLTMPQRYLMNFCLFILLLPNCSNTYSYWLIY